MKPASVLLLLAAALCAAGSAAGADPKPAGKLYKWVDDKGVTHYTQTIPPDATKKSSTEIDKRGRVVKKNEAALTEEQIQAIEEDKRRAKVDAKRNEEQRRKDNALINTYTNEAEIDSARDRAVAGATQAWQAIDSRLKMARSRADAARKQVAAAQKGGKPAPDTLTEELAAQDREVAKIEAELKTKEGEIQRLKDKYENDRQRYRELMAGARK